MAVPRVCRKLLTLPFSGITTFFSWKLLLIFNSGYWFSHFSHSYHEEFYTFTFYRVSFLLVYLCVGEVSLPTQSCWLPSPLIGGMWLFLEFIGNLPPFSPVGQLLSFNENYFLILKVVTDYDLPRSHTLKEKEHGLYSREIG